MAVNETIVTGRKFRRLINKESKLWQRISYWTKACDVEFNDGENAEEKIASINNELTSINTELEYRIGRFRIYKGEDGYIYIIDENGGADAVPKKLGSNTLKMNIKLYWCRNYQVSSQNPAFFVGGADSTTIIDVTEYSKATFSGVSIEGEYTDTPKATYKKGKVTKTAEIKNNTTLDLSDVTSLTLSLSGGSNMQGDIKYEGTAIFNIRLE